MTVLSAKANTDMEFGYQLVDSISISEEKLNLLFAALFLTSLGVFVGGNLLSLDLTVLLRSAQIALPCLALLAIFYAISRSTASVVWGLVLTYGVMCLLVFARQSWLIPVVYGGALVALGYAIRFLRVERAQWSAVLLMALVASATILGVERGASPGISGTFDMLNRLNSGDVHRDMLFHASIAAMIKNYGVSSTGLQGLVEVPYHVLSHVLYASVSLLSGLGVIEVYGVANWVLFAPILVFGLAAGTALVDRSERLSIPILWGVVCGLLVVIPTLFRPWAVWHFFFVSESYMISLGLLALGLPLLYKQLLSRADIPLILLLTLMMSMAKMSVGPIFAGLWLVRLLFLKRDRIRFDLAALLVSAAAAAWVVSRFAGSVPQTFRVSPLSFIVSWSLFGDALLEAGGALRQGAAIATWTGILAIIAVLSFLIFHFLLNWIVVMRVTLHKSIFAVLSTPISAYSLAAALVGALVTLLIEMPGVDDYWFSNVALFVALPGVAAWIVQSLGQRKLASRTVLLAGALVACVFGASNLHKAGLLFPAHVAAQENSLIAALVNVRQTAPLNIALRPDEGVFDRNPVQDCAAQPFVFPAVSERPWVDVIAARNDCVYQLYGYRQYGITASQHTVTVEPRLLAGMTILNWSYAPADPLSSHEPMADTLINVPMTWKSW